MFFPGGYVEYLPPTRPPESTGCRCWNAYRRGCGLFLRLLDGWIVSHNLEGNFFEVPSCLSVNKAIFCSHKENLPQGYATPTVQLIDADMVTIMADQVLFGALCESSVSPLELCLLLGGSSSKFFVSSSPVPVDFVSFCRLAREHLHFSLFLLQEPFLQLEIFLHALLTGHVVTSFDRTHSIRVRQ